MMQNPAPRTGKVAHSLLGCVRAAEAWQVISHSPLLWLYWSCVQERLMLLALFSLGLHNIQWAEAAVASLPGNENWGQSPWTAMPQERASPSQDVGSSLWAMKDSSHLDTFLALQAWCQVQKRSCFCYALCSKATPEPRAGVSEDREMLFAALIQMCW